MGKKVDNQSKKFSPTREKIHEIIFETGTKEGKFFDIALLICITISVFAVILETVPDYQAKYSTFFTVLEWSLTIVFTIEYALRLYAVRKPIKYATSFFGIVDLISIIPTYLSFFLVGSQSLMAVRALRLLRVFRIFKLTQFMSQSSMIKQALLASRAKIFVFVFFIVIMVSIFGSLMYLIEGAAGSGFDSIPRSIYWAIVTLTTVGYGDIAPSTPLGQFLASLIMISGYAIIAVPTGIVTAEALKVTKTAVKEMNTETCRYCAKEGHADDAIYCKYCGETLNSEED
jgi:voltage-gated potassium channel